MESLDKDITYTILQLAAKIVHYSAQEMVEIDTTDMDVTIGEYQQTLSGYPALTGLRLTANKVLLQIESNNSYIDLVTEAILSLNDKLVIIDILEAQHAGPMS